MLKHFKTGLKILIAGIAAVLTWGIVSALIIWMIGSVIPSLVLPLSILSWLIMIAAEGYIANRMWGFE